MINQDDFEWVNSGLDHWKIVLPQLLAHGVAADHASFYSGRCVEMVG